ncbi:unnamed protein product [Acanthoscelides obtectus]|uniref:Microtubule-associated protein Jupiter n=1 Tax=Acanthoscelides obtectus TaxID=200917 RepID=A0A9P0JPQ9_ACAOB|nr:unnamed protein product [Acanthoscelides obtectus]CAK1641417.1 hypothetical protein AOBTE_LOCUS12386 [Acanthoscelides obtectus]
MTSTSFNVGFGESSKNSSRVLRPPGGGHTNIFATEDAPNIKKDHGRNASSILEGTNQNTVQASPVKKTQEQEPPKPAQQAHQLQQKQKVPPGGFSSGLW